MYSFLENRQWIFTLLLAVLVPIMIPTIQFGLVFQLWNSFNLSVDRSTCTCSCWDTVFKANYESGVGRYKHVYFNVTKNSFLIWTLTVLAIVAIYEAAKKVLNCLHQGTQRLIMILLFALSVYPNYYSYWSYFNYLNDDFYSQFSHQTLFAVTEIVSTVTVLNMVDRKESNVTPRKLLVISSIAILHILASGLDQFVSNVINGEGRLHQILRDFGFMIPDLFHVFLPILEMKELSRRNGVPISQLAKKKDLIFAATTIVCLWMICMIM